MLSHNGGLVSLRSSHPDSISLKCSHRMGGGNKQPNNTTKISQTYFTKFFFPSHVVARELEWHRLRHSSRCRKPATNVRWFLHIIFDQVEPFPSKRNHPEKNPNIMPEFQWMLTYHISWCGRYNLPNWLIIGTSNLLWVRTWARSRPIWVQDEAIRVILRHFVTALETFEPDWGHLSFRWGGSSHFEVIWVLLGQ